MSKTLYQILAVVSLSLFIVLNNGVFAQSSKINIDKNLVYRLNETPERIDNYNYTSYFTFDKDVYNLKDFSISRSSSPIIDFKVNPAGYSYAVLSGKGKKFVLTIYDTNVAKRELAKINDLVAPTAISYSHDGKLIYLADNLQIRKISSKTLSPEGDFSINGEPKKLLTDPNGLFLVCIYPNSLDVYNIKEGILRKNITSETSIADATFSKEGDMLCFVTVDGSLESYNVRNFSQDSRFTELGNAISLSIHPDGKYAAIATSENRVQFINFLDDFDRPYIVDNGGPRSYTRFVTDKEGALYITFDTENSIVYKRISGFIPHFAKLMRDQLNDLMAEWTKMRPMETEEEYRARVNSDSIEKQRKLFANEIATSLAGDLISRGAISLGRYNPQTGLLAVNIGSLPTIYLKVPPEDMLGFGAGLNLQFSNAVYGITPDDTFELIYVDVFNPTNGKSYSFDNLDRQDLTFLATDDSFVSIDLIMKSNREDVMLKGIKSKIVEEAMANNLISEHTKINVDTRIVPAFDANGKRINNYRVAFDYTVDADYSEQEDFPSGKYMIEHSNAAKSMMRIIRQAFDNEFAEYISEGKKLIIDVTGSADAAPINRGLPYDGTLGYFDNEPVKVNGELTSISISQGSLIRTNEQLAFLRAQSLKQEMEKQLVQLSKMEAEYNYTIEVSKNKGGQYRRIGLSLTFVDAI
ncbi:MAG: WD40 repeat domain-containing protein [Muribaculaceae bacterium]|nr:WD40 repeat domain-containing protein [Muribaculaceae bacterium]